MAERRGLERAMMVPVGARGGARLIASAVVILLGACSFTRPDVSRETAVTDPPLTTTTAVPAPVEAVIATADLVRTTGGPAAIADGSLNMQPLVESGLIVFPVTAADARCVVSATLEMQVISGADATPVEAWVSLEQDAADVAQGQSLGGVVIARDSPSAAGIRAGERMTWEVADLLRWSAERYSEGDSLVLAIKPKFSVGEPPVELGSVEGGSPAVLHFARLTDCS
jgi:hypothetical protein